MKDYSGLYLSGRGGALFHYGIKGQEWGNRRFQNKDMTWTEAGKERYGRHGTGRRRKSIDDGTEKMKRRSLSDIFEDVKKKNIAKNFDVDPEYLKNTKVEDIDVTKLTPKHSNNTDDTKKFIMKVAADTLIPGAQLLLPFDIYRGYKYFSGKKLAKQYEEERESEPIDKKTGFHLKTKNLSEAEDIKRVNPEVNDFNSNTKSNCVLCTMTMEMRRRGYDVTANKAGLGYMDHELTKFFKNYKTEHIGTLDNIWFGESKFYKDAIRKLESQPEGSRGNLSVTWMEGMGGHSMYYEIKDGKVKIYDGQTAKIYSNPESILDGCYSIDIGRLDNLEFDSVGIKEACR